MCIVYKLLKPRQSFLITLCSHYAAYIHEPKAPLRMLNLKLKQDLTFINFPKRVASQFCWKGRYCTQCTPVSVRINLQPSTCKAPQQDSSENKYAGSSRGIGIHFTCCILTETKLNCAVTNLLFNVMFQK
jgi:hypothetical protein